jgi:phenylalanyl-tRNA synthetase alpha subunit
VLAAGIFDSIAMSPVRVAMLKYGIDDFRLFHGNDLRVLRQFP